ncbi:hypothetical protein Bp8pC_140 [Bacillus phage Bp8p-C]|uniref:Uncharacterized protein n=2 Tax=Agatevirus Bp8pC TaxID=1910937 RepID=A0A0A0PLH0_9CAUD|nr:hypothetical protein AXJ20_gp208 [Bacillus phage Bp8p-C]YP_009784440.1 hypothetical protein QLX39_gp208 [Bacillus phage Bp8p-T]AHJ87570.1 hypothetical protein Bp8pC_140 [Bacillus phage Bp8p-C]AHJ87781.1 hypothetical protein Bp8pT_140 [Bacillus phage Bp8p-T]
MENYDLLDRVVSLEAIQELLEIAQYHLEMCKVEDSEIIRDVTKRDISEIGAQRLIEYLDGELRQRIKMYEEKVRKYEKLIRRVNSGEEVTRRDICRL